MKRVLKELLKIVLVFILCFILIYFPLTIKDFFAWCDKTGVEPFRNGFETIDELDVEAINEHGKEISNFAQLMKESEGNYELEPGQHYTTEYFDPISYAVFTDLQINIYHIVSNNIRIAVFLSTAITVGYVIITKAKTSNILKFIIGYFLVLIVFPPIYMYSFTNRFWSLREMYLGGTPKAFYIAYTIIFIAMFFINYMIGKNMTNKLNETMQEKK